MPVNNCLALFASMAFGVPQYGYNDQSSSAIQSCIFGITSQAAPASGIGGGGIGQQSVSDQNAATLKTITDCLLQSVKDTFGLAAATAASGIAAIPLPKDMVPPYRSIGIDKTNIISVIGFYVRITIPKVSVGALATTNLLRVIGRLNPYVFGALLAIETAAITIKTYDCYEKATTPGPPARPSAPVAP